MKKIDVSTVQMISEFAIGGTFGLLAKKILLPKCTGIEKIIVCAGTCIGAIYAGRMVNKEIAKICDDLEEEINEDL